jgi:hypothetical protein
LFGIAVVTACCLQSILLLKQKPLNWEVVRESYDGSYVKEESEFRW